MATFKIAVEKTAENERNDNIEKNNSTAVSVDKMGTNQLPAPNKEVNMDKAAERRAKKAEWMKKKRQLANQEETPDQIAERRAKAAQRERERRLLRGSKVAEWMRQKRKLRLQEETPEQIVERLAKASERERKRREQLKLTLTPEELAAMRSKMSAYARRRRQQILQKIAAEKQAAQITAERERNDNEYQYNATAASSRTIELAALKQKENEDHISQKRAMVKLLRKSAKVMKQKETPEQIAERRTKATERERKRREQLKLSLTPEEIVAMRSKVAADARRRRQKKRFQIAAEQISEKKPIQVKLENTDETFTGSYSWSSYETSEANTDEAIVVKSEYPQCSSSSFASTQASLMSQYIPQNIESLSEGSDDLKHKLPVVAVFAPVVQTIIIKEEIDL